MKKKGLVALIVACIAALSFALAACEKKAPAVPDGADVDTLGVPLGNFEITAPVNGSTDEDVNLRVSWTAEINAERYTVQLSKNSDFAEIIAEETTDKTFTAVSETLGYETKYYIRIFAMKSDGNGNYTALSYRSVNFTTKADHDTPVPDLTATRVIHDFEDFADDYEIGNCFSTHTGGDPLTATLAVGQGVDGSNAMKLTYAKEDKGWSAVQSMNPPEKKNWSGATGIRFWIDGKGNGGKFTVSVGKRGYQRWSAQMTLNAADPMYVSVPFSAFEDAGGGDGVWDMSGIVRLWFYFHAATGTSEAEILIDDITIGSDELHSTDTRANVEKLPEAPKKQIETGGGTFETFDDEKSVSYWSHSGAGAKSWQNTDTVKGLKVYDGSFGNGSDGKPKSYTLSATGYDFERADFSEINALSFSILPIFNNKPASGVMATMTVTIGSENNYYTFVKEFDASTQNNVKLEIVCKFDKMELKDGSEGALDKSKIDTLSITVASKCESLGAHQVVFDDMKFFTAEPDPEPTFVPDTPFETFETYSDKKELTDKWQYTGGASASGTSLAPDGGNTLMKIYSTKDFSITASGYDLGNQDFSTVNGFRMAIKTNFGGLADTVTGVVATITVTIGSENNFYSLSKDFFRNARNSAEYMICDFAGMKPDDGVTTALDKSKIDTLKISVAIKNTNCTGVDIRFDDLEFYSAKEGNDDAVNPFREGNYWTAGVTVESGTIKYSQSASGNFDIQYKDFKYVNYQNTYAIKFTLKTTNVSALRVRLLSDDIKGFETDVTQIADGQYTYTLYYSRMTATAGYKDQRWGYIIFRPTFGGDGGDIEISDVKLLVG